MAAPWSGSNWATSCSSDQLFHDPRVPHIEKLRKSQKTLQRQGLAPCQKGLLQLRHWQLSQLFHWKPGTYSYSEPLKLRCWEPLDGLGVLHQLALATFQPLLLGTFEALAWEPASWEPWKPGNLLGAAVREKESKERILLFCLKIKPTESATSFVSTSLCDLRAMPSLVCGGGDPIFSRLSCEPGSAQGSKNVRLQKKLSAPGRGEVSPTRRRRAPSAAGASTLESSAKASRTRKQHFVGRIVQLHKCKNLEKLVKPNHKH